VLCVVWEKGATSEPNRDVEHFKAFLSFSDCSLLGYLCTLAEDNSC
jgi:hypothetical protein